MSGTVAIDHDAAVTLIAAAASAAGPCPAGAASKWEREVKERAEGLMRLVPGLVERSEVLASVREVPGVLAGVEEIKGRGVITCHATIGNPQRGQEVVDGRPVEHFRTGFLNTPEGQAMFDLAKSLVGRFCRFGKRVEEYVDGGGQAGKVNMVEWIEDLGPDPKDRENSQSATNGSTPRQAPIQARTAPPAGNAPAGPIDPDAWFHDNGWRDKQEHDELRKSVKGAKDAASDAVRARFDAWVSTKPWNLNAAWPAEQALLLKSRLIAYMDEEEQAELVAAGGVAEDYSGFSGEPF